MNYQTILPAYESLIDSLKTPDDASFANVFLFLDEDKTNNLISYYAYGILEEDYNITPYLDPKARRYNKNYDRCKTS